MPPQISPKFLTHGDVKSYMDTNLVRYTKVLKMPRSRAPLSWDHVRFRIDHGHKDLSAAFESRDMGSLLKANFMNFVVNGLVAFDQYYAALCHSGTSLEVAQSVS